MDLTEQMPDILVIIQTIDLIELGWFVCLTIVKHVLVVVQ